MEIYIVQPDDTIERIAAKFNITVERLISDNGLINSNTLVQGQALVILKPQKTYLVKDGDSLSSIADLNGITLWQLIRLNPFLYNRSYIYPGETLVVSYNTEKNVITNGFAFCHINRNALIKTLPYLTYLSIFNYRLSKEGDFVTYGVDEDIIMISKNYDTVPLLTISALSPTGELDLDYVYDLLLDNDKQEKLTIHLLEIIRTKGFSGVNALMTNINVDNQNLYIDALSKLSEAIRAAGYIFILTINPNIQVSNSGLTTYEKLDFESLIKIVDNLIFMQEVWGKNYKPPAPVISVPSMKLFINDVTKMIPPDLLSVWIPLIGYDWYLPYRNQKSYAISLSLDSTLVLAAEESAIIRFDKTSQTPYFNYIASFNSSPEKHIVWFVDARSIDAVNNIIDKNKLAGATIWNIMNYNQQLWSIMISRFSIFKQPVK